jgi:hypothetical protein
MHLYVSKLTRRARTALCVLTITAGLALAPALVATASATELPPAPIDCSAAKALWQQAVHQRNVARANALAAAKAVAKSRLKHQSAARQLTLKNIQVAASKKYRTKVAAAKIKHTRMGYACAADDSAVKAYGAGKTLALLAIANGLDVSSINADQLTALIEQFLPGITDNLDPGQLTALLTGFNSGSALSPTDVLGLLGGLFSPDQVTSILGGLASPEVLTSLLNSLVGQLSGMGGGLPIPGDLDLAGILDTVTGILGSDGGLGTLCGLVPIPVLCG